MRLRRELQDSLLTEVQRFKTPKLSAAEEEEIKKDLDAFVILEIRKYGDPNIIEKKAEEMKGKRRAIEAVIGSNEAHNRTR